MNNQLTSPIARLGERMVDFALESARGRVHLERSLHATDSADATALAPAAWLESALLWLGLRLSGARAFAPR